MKTYGITDLGQLVFTDADIPDGIPVIVLQPFAGTGHRIFLPSYPVLTDEFMQAMGMDERMEFFMRLRRGDHQLYRMPSKVFDVASRTVREVGKIDGSQCWTHEEKRT